MRCPSSVASDPRSPDHISWAIRSVSSSSSKRSPSGGNGKPSARDSYSFQAAPMPSQARPPDSTSSVVAALIQRPGLAVVDAAHHQPEPGTARMRGHEPERRPALEHGLFDGADAADLEEVVHDPDRVESGVVRVAHDAPQGRADGLRSTRPRERRDLQAELHRGSLAQAPDTSGTGPSPRAAGRRRCGLRRARTMRRERARAGGLRSCPGRAPRPRPARRRPRGPSTA